MGKYILFVGLDMTDLSAIRALTAGSTRRTFALSLWLIISSRRARRACKIGATAPFLLLTAEATVFVAFETGEFEGNPVKNVRRSSCHVIAIGMRACDLLLLNLGVGGVEGTHVRKIKILRILVLS